MANLDLKQTASEPLAPNQDAVRDAVDPLGGLKTVAQGLDSLNQLYQERRSEHIKAQALTQDALHSADDHADFARYMTSLPTGVDVQALSHKYAQDQYYKRDKEIIGVPDRETRNYLRNSNKRSLEQKLQLGTAQGLLVMSLESEKHIGDTAVALALNIRLSPTNENLELQRNRGYDVIDKSLLTPEDKVKKKQALDKTLHKSQTIGLLSNEPDIVGNLSSLVYGSPVAVKDGLSPDQIAENADGGTIEIDEHKLDGKTGYTGIDFLSREDLKSLLDEHNRKTNAERQSGKKRVIETIKLRTTEANKGNISSDYDEVFSESNLSRYYQPADVESIITQAKLKKDIAPYIRVVETMTNEEYAEFVSTVNSRTVDYDLNDRFKAQAFLKELQDKRVASLKELSKDPHGWQRSRGLVPPNLSLEAGQLASSVLPIFDANEKTEKDHSVIVKGMGTDKERQLSEKIKGERAEDFVSYFRDEMTKEGVTKSDIEKIKSVVDGMKDKVTSSICRLAMSDSAEARASAIPVISGVKHRGDIELKLESSKGNGVKKLFNNLINKEIGQLYQGSEDANYKQDAEVIKLYIMGNMHKTGDYTMNGEVVRDAVKAVFGNTAYNMNGSYVMPPRGMSHYEFGNRLHGLTSDKLVGLFGDKSKDRYPESYGYQSEGDGKYSLTVGGVYKKDKQGNPIVINIYDELPQNVPSLQIATVSGVEEYMNAVSSRMNRGE
ncbi:hypothetical protein AP064_05040 [Candidatus Liberibacter solanacearum]|uniref:hypothetical protein n=1 Tax=Candidatus Liberibacter solanacearum TaxID=556287 RepID=UPI0006DC1777|nr:hypothetical protein [Candidatus Liberibacter solanacearum]KQC48726.1 hypothetical protein AP064_05040 [Candidatus Liberibacter solanacearum]